MSRLNHGAIHLRNGDTHDPADLADTLVDQGYKVVQVVDTHGELAVRGGIIDVFPRMAEHPLRIEFFGDEIDGLRRFDPYTQESISRLDDAWIRESGLGVATSNLWDQLDGRPLIHVSDVPLNERLKNRAPCQKFVSRVFYRRRPKTVPPPAANVF